MITAKLFENGRSQAVRLPKDYRFEGKEVMTHKIGDVVMIMPIGQGQAWSGLLNSLDLFSEDFMSEGRPHDLPQARETF